MDLTIRPVSLTDIEAITALHMASFAGYLNTRLGNRYVEKIFEWFVSQSDSFALAAEAGEDGGIVGYVVGAPNGYGRKLNQAVLPYAVQGAIMSPSLLFNQTVWRKALARLLDLFAPVKGGIQSSGFRLIIMAVSDKYRREGVGARLITELEQRVAKQGYKEISLSVKSDNGPAIGMYRKNGYKLVDAQNGYQYYSKSLGEYRNL